MDRQSLASMIDHTLLKPEALPHHIEALCDEALAHGFASVCINPIYVALAGRRLKGSPVKVCTVIGFPLGATTTAVKVAEVVDTVNKGAQEVDMVLSIGHLKAGMLEEVRYDVSQVNEAAHARGALTKVIFEISALTDAEIRAAAEICCEVGVDFIKTSTGFGAGGATVERVRLMHSLCSNGVKVKASGGIRDLKTAMAMVEAGAERLGVSASIAIIQGLAAEGGGY